MRKSELESWPTHLSRDISYLCPRAALLQLITRTHNHNYCNLCTGCCHVAVTICVIPSYQLCPTLQPHGLYPSASSSVRGIFPGKNTGVGCHALLQGIFPNQVLNPCLWHFMHWQVGSLPLVPHGKPTRQHASVLFDPCNNLTKSLILPSQFNRKREREKEELEGEFISSTERWKSFVPLSPWLQDPVSFPPLHR